MTRSGRWRRLPCSGWSIPTLASRASPTISRQSPTARLHSSRDSFRSLFDELPTGVGTVVICMNRVPYIDQSGLYALEDVILRLTQDGKQVALTGLHDQPADMLRDIGLVPNLAPTDRVFDDFTEFEQWLKTSPGERNGGDEPDKGIE
ncbi:MAG: sodium-independent anion transporter [Planctomycetota bacterium]